MNLTSMPQTTTLRVDNNQRFLRRLPNTWDEWINQHFKGCHDVIDQTTSYK